MPIDTFDAGTSERRSEPVLELVQTRQLTRREAYKMPLAVWRKGSSPYSYRAYQAMRVLRCLGFAITIVAAMQFMDRAAAMRVQFPLWGLAGFVIGCLTSSAICLFSASLNAHSRRQAFTPNTRYAIGNNGLTTTHNDVATTYPWHKLRKMCEDGPYFLMYLSGTYAIVLVKGAFEGQDVDGFCEAARRLCISSEPPSGQAALAGQ